MTARSFSCQYCGGRISGEADRYEESSGEVHHLWTCGACGGVTPADFDGRPILEDDLVEAAVTREGVEAGTFIGRVLIAGSVHNEGGPLINGEHGGFWPPSALRVVEHR
jgi:hypothetical protein